MNNSELDNINEQVAKALGWQQDTMGWLEPSGWKAVEGGVMRRGQSKLPDYSRSIEAAWEIVEKMHEQKMRMGLNKFDGGYTVSFDQTYSSDGWTDAEKAPLAICLAFLKVKGIKITVNRG